MKRIAYIFKKIFLATFMVFFIAFFSTPNIAKLQTTINSNFSFSPVQPALLDSCVIPPIEGMQIRKNTTFCYGIFPTGGVSIQYDNNIILNCNGATLRGIASSHANGIFVLQASNITIINCNVENYDKGLFSKWMTASAIINSKFTNNGGWGAYIFQTNDNLIMQNEFDNNTAGMRVETSAFNIISNNSFIHNGGAYGMESDVGYGNNITLNLFKDNPQSLRFYNTYYLINISNNIWDNDIWDNGLWESNNNNYCVNNISNRYYNNVTGPTC